MISVARLVAVTVLLAATATTAYAQKSALDNIQFDGVSSDGELKIEHLSRREWLKIYPVQAKEYWLAWDCKDKVCDSAWNRNIREKAALIKRMAEDAKAVTKTAASSR